MEKRRLGRSDLYTPPLSLGCNVFGWTIDEQTSFDILDAFTGRGFNLLDTADIYCKWATGVGGESESIIGRWLKKSGGRSKVILATKCGMEDMTVVNIRKKYILQACEASLRRLQTDHIDLYQTHKDDGVTPVEETLEAYQQLIKEGKIRWIGASNFTAARLKESLAASEKYGLPRYQTLQPLYNLCDREVFEKELQALCVEQQVSVINYYALAAGFLTGKYRNENDLAKSVRGARAKGYLNERGLRILRGLDEVAARHKASNSSVAVAWLMRQPSVAAPIASATSTAQLGELFRAADLRLSEEDMQKLNNASAW
jgi:aryl-alcohol dehydrogenase-like predicted oxidoreductase